MNSIIKPTIKRLGFCCSYAYFHASRQEKVSVVALELSVCERTVKLWRRRYRDGLLTCPGCKGCFITPHPPALLHRAPIAPAQFPEDTCAEE